MFPEAIHRKIYFYLFAALACALPLSVFATSLFQILLLLNWIVEGNIRNKWRRITTDKAFLVYAVFYAVHLIGMAWSKDMQYGLGDLRAKLPMIVIPFVFVSSGALSKNEIRQVIFFFIAGTLAGSAASVMAILGVIPVEVTDFRDVSLFIGHIRFALMVVLSIFFSAYFIYHQRSMPSYQKGFYLFSIIWLTMFLFLLKSLSGIVIFFIVLLFIAHRIVRFIPDKVIRFMSLVIVIFIPLFILIYVSNAINRFYTVEEVNPDQLDSLTINGNPYIHHTDNQEIENGNYVWLYLCPEELEQEWNRVSEIPYQGKNEQGDRIRFSLIRYLASKGLRKDSVGVSRLTPEDIEAIENGVANHIYLRKLALYPRIYEAIWEFDRYRLGYSANDKSLVQRYYYLQAGWSIFKNHFWTGVGTGDVRESFNHYYQETDSALKKERRRRAHNQFLTLAIAFGLPGFLITVSSLIIPVFIRRRWHSYLAVIFLLTMALSMLDEDNLENTPGIVMFGLFYTLFVFGPEWSWKRSNSN